MGTRRRRSDHWESEFFGPGTDLSITLFAIMALGFLWMSGLRKTMAGELDLRNVEVDELVQAEVLRASEVLGLQDQLGRFGEQFETPELAAEALREAIQAEELLVATRAERDEALAKLRNANQAKSRAVSEAREAEQLAGERRLEEFKERLLRPYTNARVMVRISADFARRVPDEPQVDLDLHLQLPSSSAGIVNYLSAREFEEDAFKETGALVLSEDFERISGRTEEAYYGLLPLDGVDKDNPFGRSYVIACMLRKSGPLKRVGQIVRWRFELHDAAGGEPKVVSGQSTVNWTGTVHKNPGAAVPVYSGIEYLAQVTIRDGQLIQSEPPERFRGWAVGTIMDGAKELERLQDR